MNKYLLLEKIKNLYEKENVNIMEYLRTENCERDNDLADILISYDFQAGTYVEDYKRDPLYREQYLSRLVDIIDNLNGNQCSILECGVGEATVLVPLLKLLKKRFSFQGGIDISWSRIKCAERFAEECMQGEDVQLAVGDMFNIPCADNSIDIIFTRQAIEPNRGKEKEILQELYRVSKQYLIMIEPAYELADEESRKRMDEHRYITNLYGSAKELGFDIQLWDLYGINETEKNPVGIMVVKKNTSRSSEAGWACPLTKSKLERIGNVLYSKESLLSYPIVNGVPMLTSDNAIVTTKMIEECRDLLV